MKKIISIVLVTVAILFLNSCRQQDEEDEAMIITKVMKNNSLKSENNKDIDTTQTLVPFKHLKYPVIIVPETDPPPKDRDQWKTYTN